jgi:hypothetical protein
MTQQSKLGKWFSAAACAAIVSGGVIAIQTRAQDAPVAPTVDLKSEMDGINADWGVINREYTDASKNPDTLIKLGDMEKHVITAKDATPPGATTQPDAAKAAYVASFRGELIKLERTLLDVDEAISAGDTAKVTATWAMIKPLETEGHAEFRPRRGARRGGQ